MIDKDAGTIYVLTSDGKLRGLSLANGEERFEGTDFAPPHSRNWSLNLIDGHIYTTVARGCGGATAHMAVMDVRDPSHPVQKFFTSTGRPAGAWGRGGVVLGSNGILAQTADGPWNPEQNQYAHSVMLFSPGNLELRDYYTPDNWQRLNERDLDLGSASPVAFTYQGRDLVAVIGKGATAYLLDANTLGGEDHQTPLFSHQYGEELFNSGLQIDSWSHFGGLAVSDGRVYLVSWDAKLYAFGLRY